MSTMITDKEKKFLENRHRGGDNGEKGLLFEYYYTVFKIVKLINSHWQDLNNINLKRQQADSFIDDLYIKFSTNEEFYQLKNTQDLSWGSIADISSLHYGYKRQGELLENKSFSFFLVMSNSDIISNIRSSIPSEIKDYTKVIHFPYCKTISLLTQVHDEFKNELNILSGLTNPSLDQTINIANATLAIWMDNENLCSLEQIRNKLESFSVPIKKDEEYKANQIFIDILEKIPEFKFKFEANLFIWEWGDADHGNYVVYSSEFVNFQKKVINYMPLDFEVLESLME